MTAIKKIPFVLFLFLGAFIITFSACSNSTSGEHEDHEEADGFRIYAGNTVVIEQLPDQDLTGELELTIANGPYDYTIQFLSHDGDEFQPEDEEYNLTSEFSNPQVADFLITENTKWSFQLTGTDSGTTDFILNLNHGDHADFTTQAIPVTVIPGN